VEPLPYAALADFFPGYPAAERVATYATLGGVPAYLERFDAQQSLSANVRQHLFQRLGLFRSEPAVLECKWGVEAVGRSVVRELVEKMPLVVPGDGWRVHYAFFVRIVIQIPYPQMGGVRSNQGLACSSWLARRNSVASSPYRPTKCMPMGSPSSFQ